MEQKEGLPWHEHAKHVLLVACATLPVPFDVAVCFLQSVCYPKKIKLFGHEIDLSKLHEDEV